MNLAPPSVYFSGASKYLKKFPSHCDPSPPPLLKLVEHNLKLGRVHRSRHGGKFGGIHISCIALLPDSQSTCECLHCSLIFAFLPSILFNCNGGCLLASIVQHLPALIFQGLQQLVCCIE